ncbi:MAG: hypothetical protein IAE91_05270 [Ignavibacteriaceae bacterium]|nr:hypothetical protein [Ignavibacteriaceae bacterium]
MENLDKLNFIYEFKFSNGEKKTITVALDRATLNVIRDEAHKPNDWALLENFKCPHCPLNPEENKYCPVALNLSEVIYNFQDEVSFEEIEVYATTPQRQVVKKTSLQAGVSSLLGILMVSSGCPIMAKLKPMLYFHLPFSNLEETQIRALSMYLLSQYVKYKKGGEPDWEMTGLIKIYEEIQILNKNVSKKIVDLEHKDASINSLIILNNFADYVTFTLDEKMLDEIDFFVKYFGKID